MFLFSPVRFDRAQEIKDSGLFKPQQGVVPTWRFKGVPETKTLSIRAFLDVTHAVNY